MIGHEPVNAIAMLRTQIWLVLSYLYRRPSVNLNADTFSRNRTILIHPYLIIEASKTLLRSNKNHIQQLSRLIVSETCDKSMLYMI